MKKKILLFLLINATFSNGFAKTKERSHIFRLSLNAEPAFLDPNLQKSSITSYVLDNLFRNLLWYDQEKGLIPELAEKCERQKKQTIVHCELKENLQWSNGKELTAKDFLRTYEKILDPKNKARRADFLFHIKNAKSYYEGKVKFSEVGIRSTGPLSLDFELESSDPDFEFNLASSTLAPSYDPKESLVFAEPQQAKQMITSGPYQIAEWMDGKKLALKKNDFYWKKNSRPEVEYYFIPDDSIALKLYDRKELDFVRRVLTHLIPKYEQQKEFFSIPVFRFDYLGFGENLKNNLELRKALVHSLDYAELTKLFYSKGTFGCAGMLKENFEPKTPCYEMNIELAKAALAKAKVDLSKPLRLIYSSQGGDDHQRMTSWAQGQWKKNLGVNVEIQSIEQKIYVSDLKSKKQDIFRKGLAPDRPTCLAVLESFSKDSTENFLKFYEFQVSPWIEKLSSPKQPQESKKICTQAVESLMETYAFIPLGSYHFSMLASKEFSGWKMNSLNQLDLSELK